MGFYKDGFRYWKFKLHMDIFTKFIRYFCNIQILNTLIYNLIQNTVFSCALRDAPILKQ